MPSLHVGAQRPRSQKRLPQSVLTLQLPPCGHPLHPPPQSRPVSIPFFMPSVQVGIGQKPPGVPQVGSSVKVMPTLICPLRCKSTETSVVPLVPTTAEIGSLIQPGASIFPIAAHEDWKPLTVITTEPVDTPVTSSVASIPGVTSKAWVVRRAPWTWMLMQDTSAGTAVSAKRTVPTGSLSCAELLLSLTLQPV